MGGVWTVCGELRVCGELPNLNKNHSFENFRCAIASFNSCENCKNLIKIVIGIDFVKLMNPKIFANLYPTS